MMFEIPEDPTAPRYVRKAKRFEFHFCGHCPNVHLIFYDFNEQPICDATMSQKQLRKLSTLSPDTTIIEHESGHERN